MQKVRLRQKPTDLRYRQVLLLRRELNGTIRLLLV